MFDSCMGMQPDELIEVLGSSIVKARKEHQCCECLDSILPGQKYENVRGIFEGEWVGYKTCQVCVNIRKSLFKEGWIYTQMWEDIGYSLLQPGEKLSDWLK